MHMRVLGWKEENAMTGQFQQGIGGVASAGTLQLFKAVG